MAREGSHRTSGATQGCNPDIEVRWQELEKELLSWQAVKTWSSAEWARFYTEKVKPLHDSVPEKDDKTLKLSLDQVGLFFNSWYRAGLPPDKLGKAPTGTDHTQALQAIVEALKSLWFNGCAAEGPPWVTVYEEFKSKLPEGHLNKLKELILHGADPVCLGPKRSYKSKPYPGTQDVEMLELWDYHALVKAARAKHEPLCSTLMRRAC